MQFSNSVGFSTLLQSHVNAIHSLGNAVKRNATTAKTDTVSSIESEAFGRELGIGILPADLLAQTDPRQVVADARRLPEDVTNWPAWNRWGLRRP